MEFITNTSLTALQVHSAFKDKPVFVIVQCAYSILRGGGFHSSGCPNIQSDQTLMLGRSSLRFEEKAETLTMPSDSSPLESSSVSSAVWG